MKWIIQCIIIFMFFVGISHTFSQVSTYDSFSQIGVVRINVLSVDMLKKQSPCYRYASQPDTFIREGELYDTLYCKGIVWCCTEVCELDFIKIEKFHYETVHTPHPYLLVYITKEVKVVDDYFYIREEDDGKKFLMKPEYIIKLLEENKEKNKF